MTRDELIEAVARSILYERYFAPDYDSYKDEKEFWENLDEDHMHDAKSEAESAIDTIFAALKEPTEEMILSGGEYVLSVGSIDCMHADDRPEFGIKGRETGSYELFKVMLSASPLAPKEE